MCSYINNGNKDLPTYLVVQITFISIFGQEKYFRSFIMTTASDVLLAFNRFLPTLISLQLHYHLEDKWRTRTTIFIPSLNYVNNIIGIYRIRSCTTSRASRYPYAGFENSICIKMLTFGDSPESFTTGC